MMALSTLLLACSAKRSSIDNVPNGLNARRVRLDRRNLIGIDIKTLALIAEKRDGLQINGQNRRLRLNRGQVVSYSYLNRFCALERMFSACLVGSAQN